MLRVFLLQISKLFPRECWFQLSGTLSFFPHHFVMSASRSTGKMVVCGDEYNSLIVLGRKFASLNRYRSSLNCPHIQGKFQLHLIKLGAKQIFEPGARRVRWWMETTTMTAQYTVGVLISKVGDTIRNLQFNSGAKIQITRDADVDPWATTRPVEIIGTLECINKAERLINEVIAEADAGGSPALVAKGFTLASGVMERYKSQMISQMGVLSNDFMQIGEGNRIVVYIRDLENSNLSGHLVPNLAKLEHLQFLELYKNNIQGTIPAEFGNLKNLN